MASTRAVSVSAEPSDVWPWLVQMGDGRGGLYSCDRLDMLFGYLHAPSTGVVLPEYQDLAVGDVIPLGRGPDWLVTVVDTERAALRAIWDTHIDVVLLDLRLREGDGFGVLRAIASHAQRPIVVVLSNYSLAEYRRTAQALGAQYFLDKAHEMEGLPAILNEIKHRTWH